MSIRRDTDTTRVINIHKLSPASCVVSFLSDVSANMRKKYEVIHPFDALYREIKYATIRDPTLTMTI